jgi:hypothetical protein
MVISTRELACVLQRLGELHLSPDYDKLFSNQAAAPFIRICAEAGWLYRRVQILFRKHGGSEYLGLAVHFLEK